MSAVLGISAYYHDSAAALLIDGKIAAAMQEERFSRRKNDAGIPHRATAACLAVARLDARDLDAVVFYENPYARLERITLSCLRHFPKAWKQFPAAMRSQLGHKLWVLDALCDRLEIPRSKIAYTDHHRSHAASAFFASPYERAAVLTVDGMGEDVSCAIWLGEGSTLTHLCSIEYPHSLGLLYAALTAYLGFEVNEGEYKVMGLAAFGQATFKEQFLRLISFHSDGSFELDLDYFAFHTDADVAFTAKLERLLGPRRLRGKPWNLVQDPDDRRFADIAASLQWVTEEAMLRLAHEAFRRTRADALCLAGGVALNCVANARLLREGDFARIFVQPAAGDAGGALGAAMHGHVERNSTRPQPLSSAALGLPVTNDAVRTACAELGLPCEAPDDPHAAVLDLIAQGKVGGFVQGRFEWGPRALGQRSLLASPCSPAMRDRINQVVKKREEFRPFAPAVLASSAGQWFREHDNDMAPFMTTIAQFLPGQETNLGAVRHVDGSARVQTVDEASAPALNQLLTQLAARGEPPILLNTSLNAAGEPIVASELDSLAFFVSHSVDFMLIGDILLQRRSVHD